jgi:hypothetical protein
MTRIETGTDLKAARNLLRLSCDQLATRLRLVGNGGTAVREMERGRRDISGPLAVAVEQMVRVLELERELEQREPFPF